MRLLAEMGTLKNLRRPSIKQAGKKSKSSVSMNSLTKSSERKSFNNDTFLTSNKDDFDDETTASYDHSKYSMNGENENDKNFEAYVNSISKILDDDRRSNKMDRCYSYSDLLKLRFNYDSIYTNTTGVERGNRSFYPVYKKFMYLLDKNALKHSFNETSSNAVAAGSRPDSPTSPTILTAMNEENKLLVHINSVTYTNSPEASIASGSRNNSPTTKTIKSQVSNFSLPQQHESFLFGSTIAGTVAESVKPSNTFLEDSFNIEGGSSTYLNKLVKKLTAEQELIKPYLYPKDDKPKRGIRYFEPSKNEVYQLDPFLVNTSTSKIEDKSKSKLLKASMSIGNTADPSLQGLRTNTLIHKSSTSKLKLNAAFKVPNPNPLLNPNLKPNFKDLPPLISKRVKMENK